MSSPDQRGPPEPGTNAPPDNDSAVSEELSESSSSSTSSSSNSDTEPTTTTKTEPPRSGKTVKNKIVVRMLNLCKEITIMCIIAVAYAALTNESLPKVSKSPAAYPFFSSGSPVRDWYRGQITEAIEQARTSDIAFVMFYAPWDAESQVAKSEFEKTAKFMQKTVSFSAINCWQPGSECKRQYSKVYKWPVLIAYPTHGRGIQYNGPLEANHMIKFLQNICKPLVLPEKINEVIARHDAVVLAYVNLSPRSFEFSVFYLTAMRFLEKDPFRDVSFAVLPRSGPPSIHLFIWNATVTYEDEWNPDAVSAWILKNLRQVTGWVSPTGTKSLSLSNYIQPGPTLILFTPKNPLYEKTDYYDLLKEVAYEFYNCNDHAVVALKQKLVRLERMRNRVNHREARVRCLGEDANRSYQHKNLNSVSISKPKTWNNSSILVQPCNAQISCHFDEKERICESHDSFRLVNPKTSMVGLVNDRRSPENLKKMLKKEECRNFLLSERYLQPIFEKDLKNEKTLDITGLSCKVNRSLTLVAMDTLRYHLFAEKLGINVLDFEDKSTVVIVDEKAETYHVMENPVTGYNLKNFIKQFTQRLLSRTLIPIAPGKLRNTPAYLHKHCSNSDICIKELNTSDFLETILQSRKAVLVFYYSKQCAFCSGFSYVYLSVAKILQSVKELEFTRIDGDLQSLPWEYTMESYPTFLFFPAERKSESRALPRNVPVTVPNLIGFILTNLDPVLKLKAMWAICEQTKFLDEKIACLTSVRTETLSVIDRTLKMWRMVSARERPKIVRKLQVLRSLHLLFAHAPERVLEITNLLSKLQGNRLNNNNKQNYSLSFTVAKDEL